ncbi:PREDICTED: M-phase phosphoprotein 9 [Nanorana parkeri]|uniref:M-phase phosphoprotein 9 n=1 Tax=Nanorana parkeri TaxID=125878 RepID=UPI00085426BE|nr:PREDICTED: M-phase phosphoprotein 9 [Nanorana parkeri]
MTGSKYKKIGLIYSCVIEDSKSDMDMDTSDHPKSPTEARRESIEGGSTINKALPSPESSRQCPEFQAPSAGDLCGSEQTDPEARKNCEARWLQLFQLVERQCQDQIDAQQEQFNRQLQLIREEIKRLAQLQGSSFAWNCGTGNTILPQASGAHPPSADIGQHSQDEDRGESTNTAFHLLQELDIQKRAFITQEHFQENTSISSGYGTLSASEPNACLSSCSKNTSRKARLPTQQTFVECRTELTKHPHLTHLPVDSEKPFMLIPDTKCLTHLEKSSEGDLSGSHTNYEKRAVSQTTQPASKPLTTWAQKLRQTHQKRSVQIEQSSSMQSNPHSERDSDNTEGSSNMFFLNNRAESANSLFSTGSGFTYWMLDEKDLYHPLPDNLETGVSKLFHAKEPDEARIPSLTDLYHRKQREYGQCPAWEPLPPSEHTHPPEILTLDPTLHKKHPHSVSLCNESYTAPLTPDSILESAPYKQYDDESLSATSSLLGDSPNRSPHSPVADVEQCKSTKYQTRRDINYHPRRGDSVDERMNCTEDDVNSLTPSSMPQSPLPVAEESLSHPSGVLSADHPMMLSNIRRSLREKHARHLADLRDYYESEISNLKQQLVASNKSTTTSEDLMKISSLTERCSHMDGALAEASKRIRMLENKNNELEKQVAEWKDRYYSASNTSKDLQAHIEEMRTRSMEKETAITRLQSRLKEVEGSFEKAFKKSDDKDERIKQEHKMFQDLLLEYKSLGKEHERVKDTLGTTENKVCEAQTEVNELRRTVSKLETQIRQLEHENMVKLRRIAKGQSWSSSLNKELSHTVGSLHTADTAHWKTPGTQCTVFSGQPVDNKTIEMENKHDASYVPNRHHSPPEKEALHNYIAAKPTTEERSTQESPILKALRDFEEEKGLKGWKKESSISNLLGPSSKPQTVGFNDCCTPRDSPDKNRDRQKHLNSPAGPRSSSLPPSIRKTSTVTTPTKRELMLIPLQVKYSPKRSPIENLSPGLSQLLCDEENTMTRYDVAWAESSKCKDPSPRKRLQFMSLEDSEEKQKTIINPKSSSESQLPLVMPPYETEITCNERMKNMADTERLFDELTEEKKQIEAALSRMPSVGHRMSMQTRVMKENLEDRLEKINRDLGSIRMTLKKYHILPTSANI